MELRLRYLMYVILLWLLFLQGVIYWIMAY